MKHRKPRSKDQKRELQKKRKGLLVNPKVWKVLVLVIKFVVFVCRLFDKQPL